MVCVIQMGSLGFSVVPMQCITLGLCIALPCQCIELKKCIVYVSHVLTFLMPGSLWTAIYFVLLYCNFHAVVLPYQLSLSFLPQGSSKSRKCILVIYN